MPVQKVSRLTGYTVILERKAAAPHAKKRYLRLSGIKLYIVETYSV
jgi:hypothetical protein